MAPSQVSGMKMRNLLLGVILGLLAVVHSTPVNTVTQIPAIAEDDFYKEAVTDGFLIDHHLLTSLTTESPKRNATVQASQQPSSESKDSDMTEGSAAGEHDATTTLSVSHAQSSTSMLLPRDTDDTSSDSSTTQSLQSGFSSSSVPNEAQSSVTPDHILVSQTTDPAVSSTELLNSEPGSGSGDMSTFEDFHMIVGSNAKTNSASSTSTTQMVEVSGRSGMSAVPGLPKPKELSDTTRGSNGWIIIVGFIVGIAVLVMICVAIATRDKWNRPQQASQLETKTNSSNQQRELEMETFLHNDKPRENGKAAEYTVVPLDELPEKCSSQ